MRGESENSENVDGTPGLFLREQEKGETQGEDQAFFKFRRHKGQDTTQKTLIWGTLKRTQV